MKTSKRLLSFILAVVMALTACSAGFTALAAEVNPKDNSPFSAQNASAKGSVDALNALIDQYLPSILEMLGEDTLASAGLDLEKIKTADFNDKNIQSDSFYEMMSELSTLVYSALGGASMSTVLADEGLSYGEAYDETMYSYLNEVSSPIDFWSLYQLCKDNAKDGGNEMEQLYYDYLNGTDSITGLKDLLQAQPTLFASAQSTVEATSSYVNEWAIALNAGYVDDGAGVLVLYDGITVESIQKAIDEYEAANGKIVLSGTDSNGQTVDVESYYSYINYVYKYAGISVNADSLAKAIYYGASENLYMPLMFAYVEELRENGITELFGVSADSINTDNFLSIIESNLYSYSDHEAMMKDMGITDEAQVKATYKIYAILSVSEVFLNYSDYLPQDYTIEERILSFAVNATISTQLEAYKYNPENYPVDSSFMINAVNSIINGYVDMIDNLNNLVPGMDINSIVNSIMSSLIITKGPNGEAITTEIIASNLRDVYINLAEDPVSTIANLMPILTILLDEVVVPILFNQDGDAFHGVLDAFLGEIDAINTLRDQYGITRLDFDLNTIIPRLLHYIAGDNSLVTEYYSDSEVPVITTVKALDELIMPLKNYNFGISDAVLNDLLKNVIDTLKT
ncbi:MAG: hypothetical protein LUG21_06380, partial [Clostridiales bacterium]|nr:hypothetical protein [Clostridiales bacterium]